MSAQSRVRAGLPGAGSAPAVCLALIALLSGSTAAAEAGEVPAERLAPIVAGLEAPTAVAVGADGRRYVAESSRDRVVAFDPSGRRRGVLRGLDRPVSVAVDRDGRLLVGCAGNGSVAIFGPGLAPLGELGAGPGEFGQPGGIAAAADGTVYVADSRANAVRIYDAAGALRGTLGGEDAAEPLFDFPTSLALDEAAGTLVVADLPRAGGARGARLQVFTREGAPVRTIGGFGRGEGLLVKPLGVTTDPAGRIYVTDAFQNVAQVYSRDGAWLGVVHVPEHPLRTPVGAACSPDGGRLHVASLTAGRVEVFALHWPATTASLAVTLAGEGRGSVRSDPPGIECPGACSARFPAGAAVSLAALPAPGSVFAGWEGDCAGAAGCAIALGADRAVTARFDPGARPGAAPCDFDGDGRSDLLRVDPRTGEVSAWLVGAGLRATVTALGTVRRTRGWMAGESDGDGRADLLWHDRRSGATALWLMSGGGVAARKRLRARRAPRWEPVAFADFDGDRRADLLWRDRASGAVALWLLDGAAVARRRVIGRVRGARWTATAADFDGDGRADVLWHDRDGGALALWLMTGAGRPDRSPLGAAPADGRRVAGTGDFDGDGTADLLWRRGGGEDFTLWSFRAGTVRAERPLAVDAGPGWTARQVGDYDGDGRADLLLASPAGEFLACLGDGAGAARCAPLSPADPGDGP